VNVFYQTAGFKIWPHTGKVTFNDQNVSVRPKTFQLLVLLVSSTKMVSKQQILDEIWDDVVVDDQVIFQSIKELRKLFEGIDVIKTYPRKGYAWIAKVEQKQQDIEASTHDAKAVGLKKSNLFHRFLLLGIATTVLFIVVLTALFIDQDEPVITGSVVVLPIKNNIEDTNHQWVRYGAMDQLIQRLSSSYNTGVLNTDYVMEVMKRADMPRDNFERQHIEQIFTVSGTTLVIEASVTGSSGDYQLIYTLHQQHDIERGAILDEHLGSAIDRLAVIVNRKLGNKSEVSTTYYLSAFANQMLAEAIQMRNSGNKIGERQLLEAIIATEPDNLTASRLLVEVALENKDRAAVEEILANTIPKAITTQNIKELIRLRFFAAVNAAQKGDLEQSQIFIDEVNVDAKRINDWLYLAYTSEFTGLLNQHLAKFDLAQANFEQAIEYHKVLQCPLGRSNGLMHLS
jgi:transcriptional activator of cad operon